MNGGIGNAVQATPLVQAIQAHWPIAQLTLYTPFCDLFDSWCIPVEVVDSTKAVLERTWDDTFVTWSAIWPIRGAEGSTHWGAIHTVPLLGAWFIKPEREYNLDMVRRLGYEGASPPLYVSLRPASSWRPKPGLWIAMVPGGQTSLKWRNKRWPYYSELATALLARFAEVQLCIIGNRDDLSETHFSESDRLLDMRGRLSLAESAWVLKHMFLAVGNDCGPMHMADAVHVPTLVLFGPTCELKSGPQHGGRALTTSISCRPCQYVQSHVTCADPRCLSDLTVTAVMDSIVTFMDGRSGTC
jgi:ADP-heptose:LPS heptosyltransferase